MAVRRWSGRAGAVAQVSTLTVGGTPAAGQTFTARVGDAATGRAVTYTALSSDTTTDLIAAGLAAALQASTYPEVAEAAWAAAGSVVTGTGVTAGVPFTLTASAVGGTLTPATPTAATGPNHWSNAANWYENAVPVTGDDVTLDEGPAVLYGLDQHAVTLASLRVGPGFAGDLGLPDAAGGGYPEYRDRRLRVSATLVTVDTPSRRVRLDLGTATATVTVNSTGSPAAQGDRALDLVGIHVANVLRVNKGSVRVAAGAGDAATFATVDVAYRDDQGSDCDVRLGAGLTLTDLVQSGGTVLLECGAATVTRDGGTLTRTGSGAVGTLRNRGGKVLDDGTGTITAGFNGAEYAFRGLSPVTVTDWTVYRGSSTLDRDGRVTWTNPVLFSECHPAWGADPGPAPAYFASGFNRHLAVS